MASALIGPVITLFLSAIVALLGSFVLPTEIEVKDMWEGKVAEESSRDLAPDCGYIADEQSLTELWSDWRKDEELPEVDFEQELVLVGTVPGPNRVIIEKKLSDDGDLKMKVAGTEIAGPGFGYQMLRVGRQGIQSVNGEPIEFNGVRGIVDIPSVVPSFDRQTLEVKLWEFDPRLADAAANLADELVVDDFSHEQGERTVHRFHLGEELEVQPERRYYVTVFVLKDGQRTHMGERDGHQGLVKVINGGYPKRVRMMTRKLQ